MVGVPPPPEEAGKLILIVGFAAVPPTVSVPDTADAVLPTVPTAIDWTTPSAPAGPVVFTLRT